MKNEEKREKAAMGWIQPPWMSGDVLTKSLEKYALVENKGEGGCGIVLGGMPMRLKSERGKQENE